MPSKAHKHAHSLVSPVSPKFSMSEFRATLQEELAPLHSDLDILKETVDSAQGKMNTDLTSINASIKDLSERLDTVKKTFTARIENQELELQQYKLKQTRDEKRIDKLTDKLISLESYSRRNNLKFLNLDLPTGSDPIDDYEQIVIRLCANQGLTLTDRDIISSCS